LVCCEKQFSTKEPQEAPLPKNHRKLQENHNVFNEYSRQNAELADFIHAGAKTAKEIAQAKDLDAYAVFLAR
jgi:hypothetical protein